MAKNKKPQFHGCVHNMLDLSTGHMPSSTPNWGECRYLKDEQSVVVYVHCMDTPSETEGVPLWLRPIMTLALEAECILINFDPNGLGYPNLTEYDW